MTNEIAPAERHLLDHPQRLGILPTWWFWNDPGNWRKVGWGFAILAVVTNVILSIIDPPILLGGAIAAGVMLLAIGLTERYVRRQVIKRRALAASSDDSE